MLPSKSWPSYEQVILSIGEHRVKVTRDTADDNRFLGALGFVSATTPPALTLLGHKYFHARFIDEDLAAAGAILLEQLLEVYAPAQLITQVLANRPSVPRSTAETVLRSQGVVAAISDRQLGSLLALMHSAGAIEYSKHLGTFRVLATPLLNADLPSSIFVSKETPWSNRRWLHRLIAESYDHIYWLDKHWLPAGIDIIGEAADGSRLNTIRILSLELPENATRAAKRSYRDLGHELKQRGIDFEWRFLESQKFRGTHDRWIVSRGRAWNVPNLNAILSGQNSELIRSANESDLREVFESAWSAAPERAYQN